MAVTRLKPRLTKIDEVELRAFYEGCGLSADTIERAIKVRGGQPVEEKRAMSERTRHKARTPNK